MEDLVLRLNYCRISSSCNPAFFLRLHHAPPAKAQETAAGRPPASTGGGWAGSGWGTSVGSPSDPSSRVEDTSRRCGKERNR